MGRYEPVEWERISLKDGKWVPTEKSAPQKEIPEKTEERASEGDLLGSVDYIRRLIRENRDSILLIIAILIICDCDDSIEMLIALAILLYPLLKQRGKAQDH